MSDEPPPRNASLLPTIAFVLLVVALAGGVWVFPRIYAFMSQQDCIASGRMNCVRYPPVGEAPK